MIKQLPKVVLAVNQVETLHKLIIEVLAKIVKNEEDRWECASIMKELQACFSDSFEQLFYD